MKQIFKKVVSVIVSSLLIAQQSLVANSIVIDKNAPIKNQPSLDKARNGVPIVNIVKPNNNGLSHNKFSNYNVEKEGLILNNSNRRDTSTNLGGYIYGNKNLANTKTAKIILNEVTSKNRSKLEGFTEVAGDRASVVIANPNGIYINGAGFINTDKATITTANPNIKNGDISSYDVNDGLIEIQKDGLNTKNVNKAELYAKTIKINAKINANNLDIITGENKILSDGTIVPKDSSNHATVSLDSSALGGIYANKIKLIGTNKGVGVNLDGEISAQDSLEISTNGKIVLNKALSSSNVKITSNDELESNTIYGSNVNINVKKSVKNRDIIASKTDININTSSLTNDNLIASGVNTKLEDTKKGSLNIDADTIKNKNLLYAKDDINLNAKTLKSSKDSQINSKKSINIKSQNIDNEESVKITAKDNLKINNKNDINSDIFNSENSNIVATNGNLDITSNSINLNNSNQIAALNDIN
ncbi:filamentous hemagglutinin N-terminal domain-containing protein, partial [Campylobacter blaseri]